LKPGARGTLDSTCTTLPLHRQSVVAFEDGQALVVTVADGLVRTAHVHVRLGITRLVMRRRLTKELERALFILRDTLRVVVLHSSA
jgi:hypothetical protein